MPSSTCAALPLHPACYLGDEWFSPIPTPAVAIPFYLAHPRLEQLELHQMLDVEGGNPSDCQRLLRHECGHAYDHAFRFSSRPKWRRIFGRPDADYEPEHYKPRPYSRRFVRHLPNWYAQAHPEEDFAETFAVWLAVPMTTPGASARRVEGAGSSSSSSSSSGEARVRRCADGRAEQASTCHRRPRWATPPRVSRTLGRHYAARRKLWAEEYPDFYDADLRAIFEREPRGEETAARVMRRHRAAIITSVVRWTGERKYTVDALVRKLTDRCTSLHLPSPVHGDALLLEIGAYLSALVTNHLHTGRFKRSV